MVTRMTRILTRIGTTRKRSKYLQSGDTMIWQEKIFNMDDDGDEDEGEDEPDEDWDDEEEE